MMNTNDRAPNRNRFGKFLYTSSLLLAANAPFVAHAQSTSEPAAAADAADQTGLADIVVTAQKRGVAEKAQRVPIAITAINADTIKRLNVRDLSSLTTSIPNVSLDSSGAVNGQANFSIRGFGISSSIPSVEPAVGVFVDGVYQGQTYGVLTDLFDVQSIEVLRGPQGTLFGRNTTGGAVSITTRRPGDKFQINGKVSVESGLAETVALSVEGPVAPTVRAKLTGYYRHDAGYFYNKFDSSSFGKSNTWFLRPTVVWDVTDRLDQTLIFDIGHVTGDGPATANTQIFDGRKINIDHQGITDILWKRLTSETNLHVDFGDGVITNVAGLAWLKQQGGVDTDGQPIQYFNINEKLKQHQFSEELRYAGHFGPLQITIGGYYFTQHFFYLESRDLRAVPYPVGLGGKVSEDSAAAFGQAQYDVSSTFSLIAGARYSWDKKSAQVATLLTAAPRCNFTTETCVFNFPGVPFADDGTHSWARFSPKVGFQWKPNDQSLIYGNYSEGVRSGGYNVRSSVGGVSPGPYNQEIQGAFEIGSKNDLFDHRLRINVAAFYNKIKNLQRDISTPDPVVGSAQVTRNVGTVKIHGLEGEVIAAPVKGLTIGGHFGYLKGKYGTLTADLNGAAPGLGKDLKIIRLPKFTYGADLAYHVDLANGARASFNTEFGHTNGAAAQDNNTSFLRDKNLWNANVSYGLPGGAITVSAYVKNILNETTWPQAAAMSAATGGGVYMPIDKARVFGAAVNFQF